MTSVFVSRLGSGLHDGSSIANEFTFVEAQDYVVNTLGTLIATWIKYRGDGTIDSQAASIDFSGPTNATRTSPFIMTGYTATVGDAYAGRTNGSQALITTYMPTIAFASGFGFAGFGNFSIVEGLVVTGTVTSGSPLTGASIIRHCSVTNAGDGASATGLTLTGANNEAVDCDIICTGATSTLAGINVATATNVLIDSCRIHTTKGPGVSISTGSARIDNSVLYKCGTAGVVASGTAAVVTLERSSLIGNTTDGLLVATNTTVPVRVNICSFTDNGGYGINSGGAGTGILPYFCRYDRNVTNPTNIGADYLAVQAGANTTSVSQAAEYTAYSTNDFRRVAGSPGVGTGPLGGDIGQPQQATSGGGGGAIVP